MLALPKVTAYLTPVALGSRLRPGAQSIALRPVQEQALAALAQCGGLLGAIGVGHGKSYIALLAGAVLDADLSIVLVAPATVPVMQALLADLHKRYVLPETLIVSWAKLSQQDAHAVCDSWKVDGRKTVLVADEAHFARNATAARTKRLMGWLDEHSRVKFVALSGTMTTRRLVDFAHLSARALGNQSPVPRGPTLKVWDAGLANEVLCSADLSELHKLWAWGSANKGKAWTVSGRSTNLPKDTHKGLVESFGERLATAPGVVLTQDASCPASLYLCELRDQYPVPVMAGLRAAAERIAQTYRDPEGIELADDSEVIRTAKRLSLGYYYFWEWPTGVDREWMDARQAWSRKCRWLIEQYGREQFDSRGLVEREATRRLANGSTEQWVRCYAEWVAIRDRAKPVQSVRWMTDEALRLLVNTANHKQPSIVWYEESAVADKLAELGVRVVRAGEEVPAKAETLALSVKSHGAGLNLQAWSRQVFACVPANGTMWEQVLGRTHRQGQTEDEVWAWIPQWSQPLRSALAQARRDAAWIETSTSNRQKLMLATVIET